MSRDWKPGDVALVDFNGMGGWKVATYEKSGRYANWWSGGLVRDAGSSKARPLVVINPEDRDQIERFWALFAGKNTHDLGLTGALQAALREFANPTPPKPDEPTGRYAVVEDDVALEWVRAETYGMTQWKCLTLDRWADYAEIAVVRVLSEGVTTDA